MKLGELKEFQIRQVVTLRCLISGGRRRGVKINGGLEIFVKFNKRGVKINGGFGISKCLLISVMNEKRGINV